MNLFKRLLTRIGILRDTTWDHLVAEAIEIEKNPPEPICRDERARRDAIRELVWSQHNGPAIDYHNIGRYPNSNSIDNGPSLDKQKELAELAKESTVEQ